MREEEKKEGWRSPIIIAAIIGAVATILAALITTLVGAYVNKGTPTTIGQNFYTGIETIMRQKNSAPSPIPVASPVPPINHRSTPSVGDLSRAFTYEPPKVIRENDGKLLIELPVINIREYTITFIAPNDTSDPCAIHIVDDQGVPYRTFDISYCSMKVESFNRNDADYINKIQQRGQQVRSHQKGILSYKVQPNGHSQGSAQTINAFNIELLVVQKDERGSFTYTKEYLNIERAKIE